MFWYQWDFTPPLAKVYFVAQFSANILENIKRPETPKRNPNVSATYLNVIRLGYYWFIWAKLIETNLDLKDIWMVKWVCNRIRAPGKIKDDMVHFRFYWFKVKTLNFTRKPGSSSSFISSSLFMWISYFAPNIESDCFSFFFDRTVAPTVESS